MSERDGAATASKELLRSLRLAAKAHHEQARDATGHLLTEAANEIVRLLNTLGLHHERLTDCEMSLRIYDDSRSSEYWERYNPSDAVAAPTSSDIEDGAAQP